MKHLGPCELQQRRAAESRT